MIERRINDIMGKLFRNGNQYAGTIDSAAKIKYDNTTSGLQSKYVQSALDEIDKNLDTFKDDLKDVQQDVSQLSEEIADLEKQINQSKVQDAQGETVEEALAWLEENGDTSLVYLLPNGNTARYTTVETVGGVEEVSERVTGEFLDNQRLSTSSGTPKDETGFVTTPLIDVSVLPSDFKIKLTGIEWVCNGYGRVCQCLVG